MRYRVKMILLSVGVVLGFGHGFHHLRNKRPSIGPDLVCNSPPVNQPAAPTPPKSPQP